MLESKTKGNWTYEIIGYGIEYKIKLFKSGQLTPKIVCFTDNELDARIIANSLLEQTINQDQENKLTQGSIDTIFKYSGQLDLLLGHLSTMYAYQAEFVKSGNIPYDTLQSKLLNLVVDICDIIDNNPKIFNDLGFIKDIYNRVADKHLIERK